MGFRSSQYNSRTCSGRPANFSKHQPSALALLLIVVTAAALWPELTISRGDVNGNCGNVISMTHNRTLRQFSIGSAAIGANALGALAVGAFALGAFAIGGLIIGKVVVGKAKLKTASIDSLTIGSLRVRELVVTDSLHVPD